MKLRLLTAAIALGLPATAMAQAGMTTSQPLRQAEKIPVSEWSYDDLYAQGWRSDQIWNSEVHGPGGEEIGDIENIIIGKDGRILSIIAEVGGLWDIGDIPRTPRRRRWPAMACGCLGASGCCCGSWRAGR
jgi:hypothetical protein